MRSSNPNTLPPKPLPSWLAPSLVVSEVLGWILVETFGAGPLMLVTVGALILLVFAFAALVAAGRLSR